MVINMNNFIDFNGFLNIFFIELNKAMKEFSGKNIEEPIKKLESSIIYYDEPTNSYLFEPGDGIGPGLCLDISDITFLNGIYTVEFTYCYSRNDVDSDIQNTDHYTTRMRFKLNKDYTYTKYCIVDFDNFVSTYSEVNKYKNDTVCFVLTLRGGGACGTMKKKGGGSYDQDQRKACSAARNFPLSLYAVYGTFGGQRFLCGCSMGLC